MARLKTILLTACAFFTLVLVILGCNKDESQDPKQTNENTSFEQEEFVPENGGNGGNSGFCQCVAYVKHQLGITTSTANAKDWGVKYTPPGYSIVSGTPQQGDIVVIDPKFGGVHKTFGHIGFVNSVSNISSETFSINIIASNYNSKGLFTSCNCNNVNTEQIINVNNSNKEYVRFYRNVSKQLNCSDFTQPTEATRIISLNGNLIFGSIIIGNQEQKLLTISNNGNSPLQVTSVQVPTGYTSSYASGTIGPNESKSAYITFKPTNMVTNYSGQINVVSNSTAGNSKIDVIGYGINPPATDPSFSPALGVPTDCSFSNINGTGDCSGSLYKGSIINLTVVGYSKATNSLTLRVKKCSGNFQHTGTAYIKQGGYCGLVVQSKTFGIGASNIEFTFNPSSISGSQNFTAVIVSATTDKFYTLPVTINFP